MPDEKDEKKGEEVKPDASAGEEENKPQKELDESSETIDYSKELEEIQKRIPPQKRSQLDKALFRRRKLDEEIERLGGKKEGNDFKETGELEETKIETLVNQKVEERISAVKNELTEAQAYLLAKSVATNEDEAKLILFHFQNSIRPSGNLLDDLDNAKALANKKRLVKQMAERERALKARENVSQDTTSSQKLPAEGKPPILSPQNQKMLKRIGAKWDGKRGGWITAKGNFIDAKTL